MVDHAPRLDGSVAAVEVAQEVCSLFQDFIRRKVNDVSASYENEIKANHLPRLRIVLQEIEMVRKKYERYKNNILHQLRPTFATIPTSSELGSIDTIPTSMDNLGIIWRMEELSDFSSTGGKITGLVPGLAQCDGAYSFLSSTVETRTQSQGSSHTGDDTVFENRSLLLDKQPLSQQPSPNMDERCKRARLDINEVRNILPNAAFDCCIVTDIYWLEGPDVWQEQSGHDVRRRSERDMPIYKFCTDYSAT